MGRDTECLHWGVRSPKRVKADAYAHASEGLHSREIEKLHRIDRFGLEAVTGRRVFYLYELQRLICAENIETAYRSRQQAANWAEWVQSNPRLANILAEAEKLHAARYTE
mgnify:CR=1 FL=1